MRSRSKLHAGIAALVFCAATASSALAQPACTGDCDGSGDVTVDEVITLVNIALGTAAVSTCLAGDADGSGNVTVDEIVSAVTAALEGCPDVPTPTPTVEVTIEPTATPTPTPTLGEGALGTRRFIVDPATSNFKGVLAPGFEVTLGTFRGQTDGVLGDAFIEFQAGAPDENGIALVDISAASDFIVAQASIANLTICLKPIVPVTNAGALQCNGGLDYSIVTSVDRVVGQIGEEGFTAADCTAAGGSIEGPNQVCAEGLVGLECFVNADCDSSSGSGDGLCGLGTGLCPGTPISPGGPCERNADCGGERCPPVRCTAGRTGERCRNAGDCDTTPTSEDGLCGEQAANPGGCQGTLMVDQVGEDSGPGSLVIAPFPEFGLNGLPLELIFESALPCGDEGSGVAQAFALTTGTARTAVLNYNGGDTDLVFDQEGVNFSCNSWSTGSGGRFGLGFPLLDANPQGGGDIIVGFTFQGR